MKFSKQFNFLSVVFVIVFLSGCSHCSFAKKAPAPGLVGTWKLKDDFQGQQRITFKANETYQVDFDGDKKTDVWGTYDTIWDKITFIDKKGKLAAGCADPGVYLYHQSGQQLNYTAVADPCSSRQQAMSLIWEKVADTR